MTDQHWPAVACTGHRQLPDAGTYRWARNQLLTAAATLKAKHGTVEAITGMDPGIPTQWAWAAHAQYLHLAAYLPFLQQPDLWSPQARVEWRQLRAIARRVVIIGSLDGVFGPARSELATQLLRDRNLLMLADCQAVVAVWDGRPYGGTCHTVNAARRQRLPVIHINPTSRTVTWPAQVKVAP